jgi:hypothetical protein
LKDNSNTEVWRELQVFQADSNEALRRYTFNTSQSDKDRIREIFNQNYFTQLSRNSTEFRLFAAKFLARHPLLSDDTQELLR